MCAVGLTPSPIIPEEPQTENPTGRVLRLNHTWVGFSFETDDGVEVESERGECRYRLEAVNVIRGQRPLRPQCGEWVVRQETNGPRPPPTSARALVGTAEPLASSDLEAQTQMGQRWSGSRWRVALLVPFSLSPSFWRLPREERPPVPLRWGGKATDSPLVRRTLRTFCRARALPDTEWDFLAHFEMQPHDVAPIREALADLRDPRRNPVWAYVDRAVELWMTRDLGG
jgi:hypothetical protein